MEDFLKIATLTALRKEQWPDPLVEHTFRSLLSAGSEQNWIA